MPPGVVDTFASSCSAPCAAPSSRCMSALSSHGLLAILCDAETSAVRSVWSAASLPSARSLRASGGAQVKVGSGGGTLGLN
jgi:hypothetical protein